VGNPDEMLRLRPRLHVRAATMTSCAAPTSSTGSCSWISALVRPWPPVSPSLDARIVAVQQLHACACPCPELLCTCSLLFFAACARTHMSFPLFPFTSPYSQPPTNHVCLPVSVFLSVRTPPFQARVSLSLSLPRLSFLLRFRSSVH